MVNILLAPTKIVLTTSEADRFWFKTYECWEKKESYL